MCGLIRMTENLNMKHDNIVITIICEIHKTDSGPIYVKNIC